MRLYLCLIIFFLLRTNNIYAQAVVADSIKNAIKGKYIEHTDTLLIVKLSANNEYEWFEVKGDNFDYDIRPNISLANKVSLNYKFISFGIGFKLPFIPGNKDDEFKGKTKAFGFGAGFAGDHWIQDLKYTTIKGFYLQNTIDYIPGWDENSDPYILFPDLKVIALLGSTSYKFNSQYSLKALRTQTEIQLKSCGSFIPSITYNYYIIDDKSNDPAQNSSQRSKSFDGLLSIGYNYTLVINKNWYIAAGLAPGFGLKYTNLLTRLPEGDYSTTYTDELYNLSGKGGLGYNSYKFFAGTEISTTRVFSNENNTSVKLNATRIYFQIFAGYRFRVPKLLKKEVETIEEKMPFKPKS